MAWPDKKVVVWLVAGLLQAASGCKVDTSARMLTLRHAVLPDAQCSFGASNPAYSRGYYDPWVNNGEGMTLSFLVQNYMSPASDEPVAGVPAGFVSNTETHRHDAQLNEIEGCWFLLNGVTAPPYRAEGDGTIVDCAALPPAQSRIDYLSVTDVEGGGQAVVTLRILDLYDLKNLFGASFDPLNIPVMGVVPSTNVAVNPSAAALPQENAFKMAYSYAPVQPDDLVGRSAAWGANYPTDSQARVVLQFRVKGRLLSGGVSHSNWMTFPITVCPGCQRGRCGDLVQQVCGKGVCTDGTPCLQNGQCAAGSPAYCTPITLFSGTYPQFAQPSGCLPAQDTPGFVNYVCSGVGCAQAQ